MQRVGADTLHRVADALMSLMSAFGRRLTVAAGWTSTFARVVTRLQELTCPTDPVGAAGEDRVLQLLLLLLMLVPGPGRVHLAIIVVVVVAVVMTMLGLLVGGSADSVDAPPEAWLRFAKLGPMGLGVLGHGDEVVSQVEGFDAGIEVEEGFGEGERAMRA